MIRINLTPEQLSAFPRLANAGSFRDAANQQRTSQPNLSRTIQVMEDAIGRRLFDRTTRRVQLTPTGRELYPIAERLVAEFDAALGELARLVEGRRGRVVTVASPSSSAVLPPGAIAQFLADNAAVGFQIRDGLSTAVVEMVVAGRVEIGFTIRPDAGRKLDRPLAGDAFGLVRRADHPLARYASAPWTVFANAQFIAMDPQSNVRAMSDAAFLQIGIAVRPLFECAFLATTDNPSPRASASRRSRV